MKSPAYIFISYRHQQHDISIAEKFSEELKKAGHQVFIDTDIQWGANWVREIQEALEKVDYLLLLLSREAAESEMVVEEVVIAKELARQNVGKPFILPIRLCFPFSERMPYHLSSNLRSIQQETWQDEKDTPRLINQLLEIIGKENGWPSGLSENPSIEGINKAKPQPYFDPRNFITPGGAIDVDSHVYVERDADTQVLNELRKSRVMITVRGPRQIGKTSLIMRTYASVLHSDFKLRAAFVDFQIMSYKQLESQDQIWQSIAITIAEQLQLDNWDDGNWKPQKNHDRNFSSFLDQYVFKDNDTPLVLCFDEVDKVFDSPVKSDFFASVRAFYNRGAYDATWKKIYWLLSTSTEPSFFIEDLNQSPFNIGLPVELNEFTSEEVEQFTTHLGTTINPITRENILMYTGGRPFLVHLIINHLIQHPESHDELFKAETAGGGVFLDHLNRYLMQFQREELLAEAMKSVINGKGCKDVKLANRLEFAGLVRRDENQKLVPFCQLYNEFFKKELL